MSYRIMQKGDTCFITEVDVNLDGEIVDYSPVPISLYGESNEDLRQMVAQIYKDITIQLNGGRKVVDYDDYLEEEKDCEVMPVDEMFR